MIRQNMLSDDSAATDPVDDADRPVWLIEPEDSLVRHRERVREDRSRDASVCHHGGCLVCSADLGGCGQGALAQVDERLASREPRAGGIGHPGLIDLG